MSRVSGSESTSDVTYPAVSLSHSSSRQFSSSPSSTTVDHLKPYSSSSIRFPAAAVAAASYLTCSTSLTLANKHVFTAKAFNFPWTILAVQSCAVVFILTFFHLIRRSSVLSLSLLRQILIPCVLFTLYLYTNSRALRHLSLPILSVLKSLAPMGVALAERAIFGDPVTRPVLFAMLLILLGNGVTLVNDKHGAALGYFWAFVNVAANIAHVLSLRLCLSDDHSPSQKTLHSNLIAWTLMTPLAIANHEIAPFVTQFHSTNSMFRATFALSCLLAAGIGSSVFWLVQKTSGSTLSFVGACNKFAVVILGAILFDTRIDFVGWISVAFGVTAGIVFAVAKAKERERTCIASKPPSTAQSQLTPALFQSASSRSCEKTMKDTR